MATFTRQRFEETIMPIVESVLPKDGKRSAGQGTAAAAIGAKGQDPNLMQVAQPLGATSQAGLAANVPALTPTLNMQSMVQAGQGQVPYSIRQAYGNADNVWSEGSVYGGHNYLSLNSLGYSNLSTEQVAQTMRDNFTRVFPLGATNLNGGTGVAVGDQFALNSNVFGNLGPRVTAVAESPYDVTLRTQEWHPLQGDLIHGVMRDSTGELWMYQQGHNPNAGESPIRAWANYEGARPMWEDMASNMRGLLGNRPAPTPSTLPPFYIPGP